MARTQVVWANAARDDLLAIIEYIAEGDPKAARVVLDRLQRRAATLGSHSPRGRYVPELREVGVLQYRELQERPWRIVYRVDGATVYVLAVLDGRRDLQTVLLERLIRA